MQLSLFPIDKLISKHNFVMSNKIKYPIVRLEFAKSFSWANGLYIQIGNDFAMLDDNGKPDLYEDGSISINCSGCENKLIFNTGLYYEN